MRLVDGIEDRLLGTGSTFHFFMPVEKISKAESKDGKRWIQGVASTDDRDLQGEVVRQNGIDYGYFLKYGYINDDHKEGPEHKVGEPAECRITPAGLWLKGFLYKGKERAEYWWDHITALAANESNRKVGFSIQGKVLRREGNTIAKCWLQDVAITACFPGDVRVCGASKKVSRRWYTGQMVEIVLATGEKLTGTPNHPIFTDHGWVPLGQLDKGRYRIGRFNRDLVGWTKTAGSSIASTIGTHDAQNVPPTFEQVFELARISSRTRSLHRVCTVGEKDFHGDGCGGNVDIVSTDGLLQYRLDSAFFEKFGKDALAAADKRKVFLPKLRDLVPSFFGNGLLSQMLGPFGFPLLALSGNGVLPAELLPFRAISPYAESFGDEPDSLTSDSVTFGDSGRTLSQAIGFSDLASSRRFDWSGHVYNLDTSLGWYEANGIVAHNSPVNTNTWAEIVKSLGKQKWCLHPWDDVCKGGCCTCGPALKSMAAPTKTEEEEKALTAGGMGGVLRPQSLEGSAKIQTFPGHHIKKAEKISYQEALGYLQARRGYSYPVAQALADAIFTAIAGTH